MRAPRPAAPGRPSGPARVILQAAAVATAAPCATVRPSTRHSIAIRLPPLTPSVPCTRSRRPPVAAATATSAQSTGHLFHIDFGYIFGRDPKPYPPPIRMTKEMVVGMGGALSPKYQEFKVLCGQVSARPAGRLRGPVVRPAVACPSPVHAHRPRPCVRVGSRGVAAGIYPRPLSVSLTAPAPPGPSQAFLTLRKSAGLILSLLTLMLDAGIGDIVPDDVLTVRARLRACPACLPACPVCLSSLPALPSLSVLPACARACVRLREHRAASDGAGKTRLPMLPQTVARPTPPAFA